MLDTCGKNRLKGVFFLFSKRLIKSGKLDIMELLILFYLTGFTDGIKIENEKFLEEKRGKMYRVILIDADDTLFDYEKNDRGFANG